MRKLIPILLVLLLLTGCGEAPKELTNIAEYEGCKLELLDGIVSTVDNKQVLKVSAIYTNDNEEPLYEYCSFDVKAFQNDTELVELSDINGEEANLIKEVRNGQSLKVTFVFELADSSEVDVLIRTPTADTVTIGKKLYLQKEE